MSALNDSFKKDPQGWLGLAMFGLSYAAAIVLAFFVGHSPEIVAGNLLICLLGTAVGSLLGFLTAPFSNETASFLGITKALWAFVSGYILSKIDGILAFVNTRKLMDSTLFTHRLEFFLITLILACLMVYMFRRYLAPQPAPTPEKPALQSSDLPSTKT